MNDFYYNGLTFRRLSSQQLSYCCISIGVAASEPFHKWLIGGSKNLVCSKGFDDGVTRVLTTFEQTIFQATLLEVAVCAFNPSLYIVVDWDEVSFSELWVGIGILELYRNFGAGDGISAGFGSVEGCGFRLGQEWLVRFLKLYSPLHYNDVRLRPGLHIMIYSSRDPPGTQFLWHLLLAYYRTNV